jgi:hypothetical protein
MNGSGWKSAELCSNAKRIRFPGQKLALARAFLVKYGPKGKNEPTWESAKWISPAPGN